MINQRRKDISLIVSLFLMGSVPSSMVLSQTLPLVSPATRTQIEQEQALRLEQIEQAKQSVEQIERVAPLPELPIEEGERCFDVVQIVFSGNTVFVDASLLESIEFSPGCLGLSEINEYLRRITNLYVESGYVTSRAFLVPQDLSLGQLEIVIMEGKLEGVLLNGVSEPFLEHAFPNLVGKALNLRDIEQGLDQINRLSRYNSQIKLLPSQRQGYSVVDIQTGEGSAGSFGLGFGNGGQPSTGEELISMNASAGNVFGMLDSWSLSGSTSAEFVDSRGSESLYLSVDVPYGYWNVNFRTSYSTYKSTFTSNDFTFDSSGKNNSHFLDIKWLAHRNAIGKTSLDLGITHRRERNYLLGSLLDSGSRNLSSLGLTLNHSRRLGQGYWTFSPSFALGSDWFGGESDDGKRHADPKAQFYKGTLTTSYTYSILPSLTYTTTLFGQWTNHTLYGSERLSIGGEYSIRGFKNVALSGDEGYYWRNELNYPLATLPFIGHVSTQLALDTGTIAKDGDDLYERGTLTGTSLAVRTQHQYGSSSVTVGLPLSSPSRLNADDYVIYYQLNVKI
ncbi:ShlB/FhaC/HecB family hemolysin secretion/activation protein [Vibrio kyushuensis]|uniref:ShlB/FhaC/HecB family hemolysin secretion/activation protein n=1 Tax=Vibrio kyushuensis TaxID=2910249 RepID=UPI003D0BD42E